MAAHLRGSSCHREVCTFPAALPNGDLLVRVVVPFAVRHPIVFGAQLARLVSSCEFHRLSWLAAVLAPLLSSSPIPIAPPTVAPSQLSMLLLLLPTTFFLLQLFFASQLLVLIVILRLIVLQVLSVVNLLAFVGYLQLVCDPLRHRALLQALCCCYSWQNCLAGHCVFEPDFPFQGPPAH
jgi:hypothetical protein